MIQTGLHTRRALYKRASPHYTIRSNKGRQGAQSPAKGCPQGTPDCYASHPAYPDKSPAVIRLILI